MHRVKIPYISNCIFLSYEVIAFFTSVLKEFLFFRLSFCTSSDSLSINWILDVKFMILKWICAVDYNEGKFFLHLSFILFCVWEKSVSSKLIESVLFNSVLFKLYSVECWLYHRFLGLYKKITFKIRCNLTPFCLIKSSPPPPFFHYLYALYFTYSI